MPTTKTALITGASTGIGKELALIHASYGGNLILVARSKDTLTKLQTQIMQNYHVNVEVIVKDLSVQGSAQELFNEVKEKNLHVDYLMNNAGFGLRGEFYKLSLKRQQEMMNLNMIALTELTHFFLPEFVQRNSGKILNTSSTASFMPGPLQAIYFATKAYVTFFSNALSQELSKTNITVTCLMPGATKTEFAKTSGMDKTNLFDKTVSAKSVALDGYNAMLKGSIDIVTGLTLAQKAMMACIPFTPKKTMLKQIYKMQEVH